MVVTLVAWESAEGEAQQEEALVLNLLAFPSVAAVQATRFLRHQMCEVEVFHEAEEEALASEVAAAAVASEGLLAELGL